MGGEGGGDGVPPQKASISGVVQFAALRSSLLISPMHLPHSAALPFFALPHCCSSTASHSQTPAHSALIHCMHSSCDRRYDLQQLEHPGKVQLVPCGGMQLILSPGGLLGHGHCVVPQSGHLTPGPPGEMGGHSCGGEVLGSQYTVGRGGGGAALAQTTKVTIICIFMASRIVGAEPDSIAASVTAAVRLRCLNYAPWPAAAPAVAPTVGRGGGGGHPSSRYLKDSILRPWWFNIFKERVRPPAQGGPP